MDRIHLIGIGGTGLSAIARVLIEMGYRVSGSDRAESPFLQDLRSAGVIIHIDHRPENIQGVDVVVRSSAVPDDNLEVVAARAAGIPVLKRADFLGSLMEDKTVIAVAGTHGKTTTSSMIAWLLMALEQEPSFIIGSPLANLGVNARAGKGNLFVIEADEYDRMFLGLTPAIEVVTNVEYDHPDCYPTPQDFQTAFIEFVSRLPEHGTLVACGEDPGATQLLEEAKRLGRNTVVYGLERRSGTEQETAETFAISLSLNNGGCFTFGASVLGKPVTLKLQVPGRHNVANALAALTVAQLLGLPLSAAARALEDYEGTKRRFEVLGEAGRVVVVDDYAHHPTEIKATLAAARSRYPGRRLWVVWQPHTYSRTRALLDQFAHSFGDADEVIVTEVFAAREPKQEFSSRQITQVMPHPAHFIAGLPETSDYLIAHLCPGDVLLVLSAGDADQVSRRVLTHLKEVSNG